MTGHTPGPWQATARAVDSTGQDDYELGWDIAGPPEAQRGQFARAADARLAAAAPEMLEELRGFLDGVFYGDDREQWLLPSDERISRVRVLLAKVEGPPP
jgi:hypothetical protein